MTLPSEIQAIINTTEDAGRRWLAAAGTATGDAVTSGAAEALATLEAWRKRMRTLNDRWTESKLSTLDFARATESEKEALAFNLAAIPNEKKREWLAGLLGASLDFLGRILGAGLAAVRK